jgi:shikimate dehydrogenase
MMVATAENRRPRRRVDGETLIFATPGNPVAQVRLPQVMEVVFDALGINAVWLPMHVEREGLGVVLHALRTVRNFRGITVAIPYKPTVASMVDRLTLSAQACGSVNLVRLEADGALLGDMVDGAGFLRGLELRGFVLRGAVVWLVGVGGAGAAIAAALCAAGVERLFLTDSSPGRATLVAERLAGFYPRTPIDVVTAAPRPVDFAINATPCGLSPSDPLPFDPMRLAPATIVCDIIMKPKETALLAAARQRGIAIHHGHHTLDAQIPMYLSFVGIPVPDERAVIALASAA